MPNSLTLNFYDSTMPTGSNMTGLSNTSTCTDESTPTKKKASAGGFTQTAVIPNWNSFGLNLTAAPFGTTDPGLYPNTPLGMVGVVYSDDPPSSSFAIMMNQWNNPAGPQATQSTVSIPSGGGYGAYDTNAPLTSGKAHGCDFDGSASVANTNDFKWYPSKDVYGNQLNPSNAYKSVGTTDSYGHLTSPSWTNFHGAALNATDNAAYNARANTTSPAYVFALGLGGNSAGAPPDPILMQRLANDPDGDTFNSPALYPACSTETGCTTYGSQLQGNYVFAPTSAQLAQAFLQISSQILRLNK